jgi:hypothetical protein
MRPIITTHARAVMHQINLEVYTMTINTKLTNNTDLIWKHWIARAPKSMNWSLYSTIDVYLMRRIYRITSQLMDI